MFLVGLCGIELRNRRRVRFVGGDCLDEARNRKGVSDPSRTANEVDGAAFASKLNRDAY